MGLSVLVTGAAGILGRQICLDLVSRGHRVRALDIPAANFGDLLGVDCVQVAKGDICDAIFLKQAVEGAEWVLHLAAILPPASERDRERTMAVNVKGTQNLLDALEAVGGVAPLIFTSSVVTYGDTGDEMPPVYTDRIQRPLDFYGESKKMAEVHVRERGYPCSILRVAGIAVPAFLEPPVPWPFAAEQRLEFINRDDVVLALTHAVGNRAVLGRTLNVAGGTTWQMRGRDYAGTYAEIYGLPSDEILFASRRGPYDWYDTNESQRMLDYQCTSYLDFCGLLGAAVDRAISQ